MGGGGDFAAASAVSHLPAALWKVEQRLAHIRENLATRELAAEFERAHELRKGVPKKR